MLEAWVGTSETAVSVPESFVTGVAPEPEKPVDPPKDVEVKPEAEVAPAAG